MRTCPACGDEKPETEFRWHSGRKKYYGRCIPCHRKQVRQHYLDNKSYYVDKARRWRAEVKAEIDAIKATTPCADCGVQYPPFVMDFDHLPDSIKSGNISQMYGVRGRQAILDEVAKCELVCANCHRIRTHERR